MFANAVAAWCNAGAARLIASSSSSPPQAGCRPQLPPCPPPRLPTLSRAGSQLRSTTTLAEPRAAAEVEGAAGAEGQPQGGNGAHSSAQQADGNGAGTLQQRPRVAVLTTLGCPYCKRTKAALQDAGVPYEEVDLGEQPELLAAIKQLTGQATVPQIFVGGRLLGGASDVLPLLEDGSFQRLVADAAAEPLPGDVRCTLEESAAAGVAPAAAAAAAAAAAPQGGSLDYEEALTQLLAEMRIHGPPRDAADMSFTLHSGIEWVCTLAHTAPEAALAALAALQLAQQLTVVPPLRRRRRGLLGVLLPDPSLQVGAAALRGQDYAISPQLLDTYPSVRVRLVEEGIMPPSLGAPLNGHFRWFGPARPAEQVAEGLRAALLRLYDRHMTADGKKVDYAALRADPDWQHYMDAAAELQKVDLVPLSRDERLAFFINIYNALVVHALVAIGPAEDSALGRLKWYDGIKYIIAGQEWSSNDIEHGVLRGNAASPAALLSLLGRPQWAPRQFPHGDPRTALAITPLDPRIHFALNCGANSCPAIKVYSPQNLELGLASAAAAFCASEVEVHPERRELVLSMILKWYGPDFGTKADLLRFLVQYLPPEKKAQLEGMLAAVGSREQDIKLSYRPYDWGTNSK